MQFRSLLISRKKWFFFKTNALSFDGFRSISRHSYWGMSLQSQHFGFYKNWYRMDSTWHLALVQYFIYTVHVAWIQNLKIYKCMFKKFIIVNITSHQNRLKLRNINKLYPPFRVSWSICSMKRHDWMYTILITLVLPRLSLSNDDLRR
jgi:hypothetical protein